MVIITADDYGKSRCATDAILTCFSRGRISSASAMVFMKDSERAAALAGQTSMEVGLHINFTMPLDAEIVPRKINDQHSRLVDYLTKNKLSEVLYNPALANLFHNCFSAQQDEFSRLYGGCPDFFNGHHHMHLCANMLIGRVIPKGERVRRTFTFAAGEKNPFNRFYRYLLARYVSARYISTDYFYSILPTQNEKRLRNIIDQAAFKNVEIEVHPENLEELNFLLSDGFKSLLERAPMSSFQNIKSKR